MPEIIFTSQCVSCGTCAAVCPTHKITMEDGSPTVHPARNCLECMHCSSACPAKAIHFGHVPAYAEYPDTPEDDTLKLIMSRRSVRHFKAESPEIDDIQWALDMAQYAPSGKNMHKTRYVVIHGKEKCDALYNFICDTARDSGFMPALAEQRDKGFHDSVTCGCSAIILGLSPDKFPGVDPSANASLEVDTVIALTTAELLLVKQGLGTCWGGYLTAFANVIPPVREYLQVPENYHVVGTLLVGIPDEAYRNIPYRKPAEIQWM